MPHGHHPEQQGNQFIFYSRLDKWNDDFGSSRINLDDCLTPVQAQWIVVAVAIPVASVGLIVAAYFLVKSWMAKESQKRVYRRRELENMEANSRLKSSVANGRGRQSTIRAFPFEIVEDD
jgi:hypothetical protein